MPGRWASPRGRVCAPRSYPWARRQRFALGGDQANFLVVFAAKNAGVDLAIARGQDDRLESLRDLFVGVDDRFEKVGAGLTVADAESSGPTSPPTGSPAGSLTLWQRTHSSSALVLKIVIPRWASPPVKTSR